MGHRGCSCLIRTSGVRIRRPGHRSIPCGRGGRATADGKGIDPALYEAAKVGGASAWQRFRHVTLPQLCSVNAVVLSVIVIDSLRSFDVVWSLTHGGPYHSSELLSTYMYSTAFQSLRLGYGSALAVVVFLLAFGVIASYLVRAFREAD